MTSKPANIVSVAVISSAEGTDMIFIKDWYDVVENACTLSKLSPLVITRTKFCGVLFSILKNVASAGIGSLLQEQKLIRKTQAGKMFFATLSFYKLTELNA